MQKKGGTEELPSDKRRRIGLEKVERPGRTRAPFGAVNTKPEVNDGGGAEGSVSITVDFTKEEVEALLQEKMKKGNMYDKKKMEQMMDLIKRFKLCVRWFKRVEEGYIQEKEKLQTDLQFAEKKCGDTENEMNNRIAELNDSISNLRMRIAKDKLDAIELHRTEKEASEKMQACLSTELEKVREEKLAAELKAISNGDLYRQSQEYNMTLQQYNSNLQSDLELAKEIHQNLVTVNTTFVEALSKIRDGNSVLQEQLAFLKASLDEATKQKEMLANDVKCLREEFKQIRDDRDYPFGQVQALTKEVAEYKEYKWKLAAESDKTIALAEACASQRQRVNMLQQQLDAEKEARSVAEKMQACLSTELEKVSEEKSAAERKVMQVATIA